MYKFRCVFLLLVFVLTSLTACSQDTSSKSVESAQDQDIEILAFGLLDLPHPAVADEEGNRDELKAYQTLEQIYLRARDLPATNSEHSEKQLKTLMLFALYASNRNSAAFNEALASDLMPIALQNPAYFFNLLSAQPVMVPAVCDRLDSYFGFEGKHLNEKPKTVSILAKHIDANMSDESVALCMQEFD